MAPARHIEWFTENVDWFGALQPTVLDTAVPACPGWTVENVVNHLTFGLGVGYPHALKAAPDCPDEQVFSDMEWPVSHPTGPAALATFEATMRACIEVFAQADPALPCYTYAGPGLAAFWFRRAAIETTLHRMDVVEALETPDSPLTDERIDDAIAESVEFALPLAARWTTTTAPALRVQRFGSTSSHVLGEGPVAAVVSGEGTALLGALWGRSADAVEISGDPLAATAWLSVVERAFAGR